MNQGRYIFSQLMDHLPWITFHNCVRRYKGQYKVQRFSCLDQFLVMAFAQLTYRESLRDIEVCLRAQSSKLYHMGIRSRISRSTLAEANEKRDWRIYADLAHTLIPVARSLYRNEDIGVDLDKTVYALDSSMIDLCLATFPWARFQKTKGAIKLHTLLDLRGSIPSFIHISDGKLHDVKILDQLWIEAGSYYIMDRGYLDFSRLYRITQSLAFFVIRSKSHLRLKRIYSRPVDKSTGIQCDQSVMPFHFYAARDYPDHLRRIKYYDAETQKTLWFLTNQFSLPALTIARLYKSRWQVELFFKWIKQNLRIKKFYGTSENAVKTQIWIAVSIYVLVAIMKKTLHLDHRLYTILQIISVTIFERMPIQQAFASDLAHIHDPHSNNQLNLFH